jgi:outer membrane lipoprotein LolB
MMRRVFPLLLLLLWLAGCATVPVQAPEPQGPGTLQEHAEALAALTSWRLSGRAAIRTPSQAGTVSMLWQQQEETYNVELRAPWGAGTVKVSGDPSGVLLRTSNGVQEYASAPRELLRRHSGLDLPLEALRYWLLGLPVPGVAAEPSVDERGLLSELRQHGWRIRYLNYGTFEDLALPTRLYLSGEGIEVRIAVQEWMLNP